MSWPFAPDFAAYGHLDSLSDRPDSVRASDQEEAETVIQIRLCDGQFVMLEPGVRLGVTAGDTTVEFPLSDVVELRCGDAELRILGGRNAQGEDIRVLGLADEDTEIVVTSPPLSDEGCEAIAEELVGRPKLQTYQTLPQSL